LPTILTGTILAISRAIGEAAPLLVLGVPLFISNTPANLMDDFTVLPFQIFDWARRPQADFQGLAAAAIVVLLVVLLSFNAVAVVIRQKLHRPLS
jgi:phosphate transport system permease protein